MRRKCEQVGEVIIVPSDVSPDFWEKIQQGIDPMADLEIPLSKDPSTEPWMIPAQLVSSVMELVIAERIALEDIDLTEDQKLAAAQRLRTGVNQAIAGRGGVIPPAEHRFKPGVSGNPGGRPRRSLSKMLRDFMDAEDQHLAKKLVRAWFYLAMSGNRTAQKELLDRIDPNQNANPAPSAANAEANPDRSNTQI